MQDSLYHAGPASSDRGARQEKLHLPLSVWTRKMVHADAGPGLSHDSIFISDFDTCLYVLETKMTSF